MRFEDLSEKVLRLLHGGPDHPLPDDVFNDLALSIFRFQCRENGPYGGFVTRRGIDPDTLSRWESIPFLPTRAFKSTALVAGDPSKVERVFRTSGTTQGRAGRGEHHVLDLSLYRASLLETFRTHLFPEGWKSVRVLCLLPSPDSVPDSSLSYMMGEVLDVMGGEGSGFYVREDGELDGEGLRNALAGSEEEGKPLLVAGTAFGFVRWLDLAGAKGWSFTLPPGSRIMETGGYKGRSRDVSRGDLYGSMERVLGVPEGRIVNEYGMTELLSQFYEPILTGSHDPDPGTGGSEPPPLSHRYHRGPPWIRTLVLDPLSLRVLPRGETGVLAHMDLANVGSVAAVLTDDLGRQYRDGFQLLGRSSGSEPRGCSLAMEDFLGSLEVEA